VDQPVIPAVRKPSPPAPAAVPTSRGEEGHTHNALRRVGFLLLLPYIFIRFSYLTDIFGYLSSSKTFLVLAFGIPVALLTVVSGGLMRAFRAGPTYWASALMLWMVIVVPFGYWKRGSIDILIVAFQTEFSMLFMIAGVVFALSDVQKVLSAISLAGVVTIFASFLFGASQLGRFSIAFGSLANANDYATHLIVLLPFLVLTILNAKNVFVRLGGAVFPLLAVFLLLKTGSRAGLLSLVFILGFLFVRGTQTQRFALVGASIVIMLAAAVAIPRATLLRYLAFGDTRDESIEVSRDLNVAAESASQRQTLLIESLYITAAHPLFGVGPGNFAPAEAELASGSGRRGAWLLSHNTYTEISSETGIPGIIFFLGMLVSSFLSLRSVLKKTRNNPAFASIQRTAVCLMVSLAGFCICIFFASMSYRFYFPALVGLIVSFSAAAQRAFTDNPGSVPSNAVRPRMESVA